MTAGPLVAELNESIMLFALPNSAPGTLRLRWSPLIRTVTSKSPLLLAYKYPAVSKRSFCRLSNTFSLIPVAQVEFGASVWVRGYKRRNGSIYSGGCTYRITG